MAMMNNLSSKYQDIVFRSILKPSGPPGIYQVTPKKERIGSLTKVTVGEKNHNKVNKTILLVGETGTGKSTLINTLFNYSLGVGFVDNVWFEIVEEETKSQYESQTSDVIVYEIFDFDDTTLPYSLTIIDTPGYGDTKGLDQDAIVSQRLLDLFRSEDGVREVNAVGLVVKASVNRLSDRLMYIFDSVMALFGKDLEKNIVALITHSNGITPQNVLSALEAAKFKCAKNERNQPRHFLFDNTQNTLRTEDNDLALENTWRVSQRGLSQFGEFLRKSAPQKLREMVNVLNERIRLAACIQNLQERMIEIEMKQMEILQIQRALQQHVGEMKNYEKFTVEYNEVYKEKEEIDGGMWKLVFYEGAVCCKVCEENCHYPGCTMAWVPAHCVVMKNGRCTVCSRKCPASDHEKDKKIYVSKTRKVKKTDAEMKKKYEKFASQSVTMQNILEVLEKDKKELTNQKQLLLDEAYQHVVSLDHIALKVDSVSTHVHLDFLIEKMEEKGDREKVQKLKMMQSQMHEGTKSALQYVWGKIKAGRRR